MYSMPIVGTSANLYFPNERNEEPIVIGCVRKNGSSCEKFSDVNNRYFSTESGNNLDLLPDAINFSRPGLSANFNDGSGITLSSSSSLSINAGYVGMFAGNVSIKGTRKLVAEKGASIISLENDFYNDAGIVKENGSDRASNEPFDDDPQKGATEAKAAMEMMMNASALAAANDGSIGTIVDLRDTLNKPWANIDSIGNTEKADSNTSIMDKVKSVGYAILAGGGKFSAGCREAIDWAGEHIGGLDFDRPDPQTGKTYRDEIEESRKRDEESYNDLREKAPCKELFDKVSNASETTLNVGSLVMGVYGAKQVVKSGISYLKANEPYIKAMSSEFKNDAAMLNQAVKNVNKKPQGITFGSNGGNVGKYASDVKQEFNELKNLKPGVKVTNQSESSASSDIEDLISASNEVRDPNVIEVEISRSKYPESANHIEDAIANGQPEILTIDRAGSKANRKASLKGIDKVPGKDLDEYPPAMFKEGGNGASVRPINPSDNRGAGSTFGHKLRQYPNGTKIKYKITDD